MCKNVRVYTIFYIKQKCYRKYVLNEVSGNGREMKSRAEKGRERVNK